MKIRAVALAALLSLLAVGPGAAGERAYEGIDQAETVTFTDSKGVETHAVGFGKLFGAPYLSAFRGDSAVEVPFERIETMRLADVVDNRMTVRIDLVSGRMLEVVLDRPEFERMYGGTADFGYFRIRLQDIKILSFHRVAAEGVGRGLKCAEGHLWFNDRFKFCPYDGEALGPMTGE